MSFAYKNISQSEISVYPYQSNKLFNLNIFDDGVTVFIGENIPFNQLNFFDPINDDKTSNNEYKRLIFQSIKHLLYKPFNENGYLNVSSSYDYLPQTTLYSGSYSTTLRKLPNITGSSFVGNNSIYNENVVYDNIYLYDNAAFDSNRGSLITILSIDKNIFGENIKPKSFSYQTSTLNIYDDGEGNIFNNDIFIGNIIYSLGIVIITNPDYICIFGSPPVLVNDFYFFKNIERPINFDIFSNDYSDCNGINYPTAQLVELENETFPDCYIGNDYKLYIIDNQNSYIPGNYKIGYKVESNNGVESNVGEINLNIDNYPLQISNISSSKICSGSISNVNIQFEIFGGIPEYSYSWNNSYYYPISGFNTNIINTTVNSLTSSLYVKDYLGNIVSSSFSNYYNNILYTPIINLSSTCGNNGNIIFDSLESLSISIGTSSYNENETIYLPTGSYTASIDNGFCNENYYFIINKLPEIDFTLTTSSISCYNGNDGIIYINGITGGLPPYSTYIDSGSGFISSSNTITNITHGNYIVKVIDNNLCEVSKSITIENPEEIISNINVIYNECYSSIELNITGGLAPYEIQIKTPLNNIITTDTNINLEQEGLSGYFITSSIKDSLGCISAPIITEIYGREYIYSGSYCEQE